MSSADGIKVLLEIMVRLRDPIRGCPWDREQNFRSIAPHTLEEAYEVADAVEREDMNDLRDELGDLLFQVVFHARMAEESGHFDFLDVARGVSDKLIRRHPHVFGTEQVMSAEEQSDAWEDYKERERRARAPDPEKHSLLDHVSRALPALTRAAKLQRRAARIGFDWPEVGGVLDKIEEELGELRAALEQSDDAQLSHEMGDLLFSCANLARYLKKDPETVLRDANARFEERFRRMEAMLQSQGKPLAEATLAEMDAAWDTIKYES